MDPAAAAGGARRGRGAETMAPVAVIDGSVRARADVEWERKCGTAGCATAEAGLYREALSGPDGCHDLPGRAASLRRLQFDRAGARALGCAWWGRGFVQGTWGMTGRADEVGAAAVSRAELAECHAISSAHRCGRAANMKSVFDNFPLENRIFMQLGMERRTTFSNLEFSINTRDRNKTSFG